VLEIQGSPESRTSELNARRREEFQKAKKRNSRKPTGFSSPLRKRRKKRKGKGTQNTHPEKGYRIKPLNTFETYSSN